MTSKVLDRVKAEVYTADTLDRLLVVPLTGHDRQDIRKTIKAVLGDVPMKSLAEGVSIPSRFAYRLLEIEEVADLKWRGDAKLFAENRRRIFTNVEHVRAQVEHIKTGGVDDAIQLLKDFYDIAQLDDHQKINVAAMTLPGSPGLCVFDEQGTGKTVTVIYAFDQLVHLDEVDIVLIFAPKSMVAEWPVDLGRFKGDLYKCVMITGGRREKLAAINSDADFFVTNYETAITMKEELASLLRRHRGRAVIVVDESFYVKNLDAKRTRAIRLLREYCGKAYVLCGTPAPNSPHDLVQQFNIVDFGYTFEGANLPEDRESARPLVQRIINERGLFIRHLKNEVLPSLPLKRYTRIIIPLQHHQNRLYVAAVRDLIVDLRSTDDKTFLRRIGSFLAKRSVLLQICSNPASVVEGYAEVPAKLTALDGLLQETIIKKKEKVVLWSFYTASIDAIISRYRQYHPVRYDGTIPVVADRREAVRKFQEDNKTMLFVANPAAAGAGLTLHRARIAVYESMSNQAAHYLQSIDRIHRRGQTRDVEYLILLCDKTIEVDEYERLITKERSAQELLGDQVEEPITRESMLSEAINALRLIGEEP
jgi:SNF2 family DNA or RNA helicase